MNIHKNIELIKIPKNKLPKNKDYKRGHCLYKLEGHLQSKYIIYDEPLDAFNNDSEIYSFGLSILKRYNLSIDEWTLIYKNSSEWHNYFELKKLN